MGLWSRIGKTFRGGRHQAEIQEELQFHLDMDAAGGRDDRQARLRLGNVTRIEEETRAMGIIEWLDSVMQDGRLALRQSRRTPALALAVVLSLAIGVGANTAIFSLVDAAILRPLPVKDPDSLRIVEWTNEGFPPGVTNINGDFHPIAGNRVQSSSVGANLYRTLARQQTGFESLIGIADPDSIAISIEASPAQQASIQYVGANFFEALGAAPILGRPFRDEEDRLGHEPVAIVSHRFWMSHMGARADALQRAVRIDNVVVRIVGVAPAGFFGLQAGQWTDVYAPLAMRAAFQPSGSNGAANGEDNRDWWVRMVGRLKPGVPEAAARTQVAALFRNLAAPEGSKIKPQKIPELITLPGRRGFNALNPRDADALWILTLLVSVLLLTVCANVANLLLSRSVSRQRESSVRLALGAPRMRLFRQHLMESGVLALMGGGAGLALGYALAHALHLLFQTGRASSNAFDLGLDMRVLAYTGGLSIFTAILFGLAPAARAARADLNDALKSQTRSVFAGQLRLSRLLVAIQIALCLTALAAAGLLGRSLRNLKWTDIGFDRENLVYASVNPWQAGYSAERVGPYIDRVRQALAALPGVLRVSTIQVRPLSGNGNVLTVNIPGQPPPFTNGVVKEANLVQLNQAGEGFFETMHIPLMAGRAIEQRDIRPEGASRGSGDAQAVVVDELFARHFFPNQNALGRRFGIKQQADRFEIVGVARDSLYNSLRNNPLPTMYQPYFPGDLKGGPIHFAIRAAIDSGRLAQSVRKAVASVDLAVPLTEFHTQTELIDRLLRTERLLGFVSGAFSLIALTLAAVGLGALLAYAVARRTNEIGIRMALGADAGGVVRMILLDSLRLAGAGIVIGLPCAYAVGRYLRSALFHLEPLDPATAVLSCCTLALVALVAAWFPARRAARIDPIEALRDE